MSEAATAAAAATTPDGSRQRARLTPLMFLREDLDLQGPYVPREARMQPAPWAGGWGGGGVGLVLSLFVYLPMYVC